MNGISFGKITPAAYSNAYAQLQGMDIGRQFAPPKQYKEATKMVLDEMAALKQADSDSSYYFEENPKYVLDDTKSGAIFKDENAFLMYKTGKGDDKYSYVGKFAFLKDAYNLADKINQIVKNSKGHGLHFVGPDKLIAKEICKADKSRGKQDALETARKILDLEA